jgi:D-sedoheptulose 7-phosphate isomerase
MTYADQFIDEATQILKALDRDAIERTADLLHQLRERGGRLFLLGVGGGAGHASHAVCDFRKIAQIEAYAPSDNVSELTARVNDDGWESCYANWLRGSKLNKSDMVFVFSVGGGDLKKNISPILVRALEFAREKGVTICGVVGRDGGFTAQVANACVLIPVVNPSAITPHTEALQAMIWHLLVSHPKLKVSEMKWESASA